LGVTFSYLANFASWWSSFRGDALIFLRKKHNQDVAALSETFRALLVRPRGGKTKLAALWGARRCGEYETQAWGKSRILAWESSGTS